MNVSTVLHNITADDILSPSLARHDDGIISLSFRDGTQMHWDSLADLYAFADRLGSMPVRQIGSVAA